MRDNDQLEKAMTLNKPMTPKSDRKRSTYGSLQMSVQTLPGRCSSRKCVRLEGHGGSCWPETAEEGF